MLLQNHDGIQVPAACHYYPRRNGILGYHAQLL